MTVPYFYVNDGRTPQTDNNLLSAISNIASGILT